MNKQEAIKILERKRDEAMDEAEALRMAIVSLLDVEDFIDWVIQKNDGGNE